MNTEGYTKLASSILTSTIWVEPDQTRIVWFTLLALCDKTGFVSGTVPGLANIARVPIEACRAAVTLFLSPDPDSRTKDHEGRRIEEVDGGWHIINFLKYRADRDPETRREQNRLAKQRERAKTKSAKSQPKSAKVSRGQPVSAKAEAEAEAEAEAPSKLRESAGRPSLKEVLGYAALIGLAPWKSEDWFNEMEACGWLDHAHRPVDKWQPLLTRIRTKWEADGRPMGPPKSKAYEKTENPNQPMNHILADAKRRLAKLKAES